MRGGGGRRARVLGVTGLLLAVAAGLLAVRALRTHDRAVGAPAPGAAVPAITGVAPARPIALVYRGPAGCPGCSEAVAAVLQASRWNFDVRYVGPNEALQVTGVTLQSAVLYAQPGGGGSLTSAYRTMQPNEADIQSFVRSGGRYLGFCMGGYLAGATPGFKLLPGDTDQYIRSPGATAKDTKDQVIQVRWRGTTRSMYVQDPPEFLLSPGATGATVIATYTNGQIAALLAPYGSGRVAVVGPHPEAPPSWYAAYHLTDPDGPDADLAQDLIDSVMR